MESLVSTNWLAQEMGAADLKIIDASAHLPDAGRDAAAEFAEAHIPGAKFLELSTFVDPASEVPAAVPNAAIFTQRVQSLGINAGDRIVIYDDSAVKTSARAWFILRLHGVKDVAILNGGLQKWRTEGRPLEAGAPESPAEKGTITASIGDVETRLKADVLVNIESRAEQLIDARGAGRFTGEQPDFRPEIPSGHIPGSLNLPFNSVYKPDGTFKEIDTIRDVFERAGTELSRPIITTCGGGVTAAVLLFALQLAGKDDVALYDGSWSEWAADPTTPKATGPATGAAS